MFTKTSLPSDGTVGPFPISFNYLTASSITVTRYDADGISNPTIIGRTFSGTPSDNQPAGTALILAEAVPAGYIIVISKLISLTDPVIVWNSSAELTQKNLRSTTRNLMEMAQTAHDYASKAVTHVEDLLVSVNSAASSATSAAASSTTASTAASLAASSATTATEQAALAGSWRVDGAVGFNVSSTLDNSHYGKLLFTTNSDAITLTLPVLATNKVISISNVGASIVNVQRRAAESIFADARGGVNTFTLRQGDSVSLASDGVNWIKVAGSSGMPSNAIGSGGSISQSGSKTANVTLNGSTGRVTTDNASLAAGATVAFLILNSFVSAFDTAIVNLAVAGAYDPANYEVKAIVQSGALTVYLKNVSGGSLANAVSLNFSLIKGGS